MAPRLKDQIGELRRQTILDAAATVFAQRGYRSATVKDVAKAAGVSDGTIYNVFESKADLLLALLEPLASAVAASAPGTIANPPTLASEAVAGLHQKMTPELLGILRFVLSEALVEPDLRERFSRQILSPALDPLVEIDGSPNAQLHARIVVGSVLGLLLLQLLGDEVTMSRAPELAAMLGQNLAATDRTSDGAA